MAPMARSRVHGVAPGSKRDKLVDVPDDEPILITDEGELALSPGMDAG